MTAKIEQKRPAAKNTGSQQNVQASLQRVALLERQIFFESLQQGTSRTGKFSAKKKKIGKKATAKKKKKKKKLGKKAISAIRAQLALALCLVPTAAGKESEARRCLFCCGQVPRPCRGYATRGQGLHERPEDSGGRVFCRLCASASPVA